MTSSGVVDGALAAVVAGGSAEADRTGVLAPSVVGAIDAAGLWHLQIPRSLGGLEATLSEQFEIVFELARHDGAAAWLVAFVGVGGAWPAARLGDDVVAEIASGGRWPLVAGTFPLTGRAARDGNGWRVTGCWGCASGITIAEWAVCGFIADGAPLWGVVPTVDVTVHRTWAATGLRATASHDYAVEGLFVPGRHTFGATEGRRRGGAIYDLPILAYLTPHHTAVTLGSARRALDAVAATAAGRTRLGSATALGDRGAFRRDLGRADTVLRAACTQVRDVLVRIDAEVCAGRPLDPSTQLDARTTATWAAEVAVEVATFAHRNGGRATLAADSVAELAYRDALTATQHVHVTDEVYETRGAAILDGVPEGPT